MHTIKPQLKFHFLTGAMLAALLTLSSHVSAQTIADNCRTLANIKDELWLVKPDGSPAKQLTNDGKRKGTIGGISPDGKLIAYMDEMPDDFTQDNLVLIDINGAQLSKTNLHTEGFVTGLSWVNPNLLRVAVHDSPTVSAYQFVQVPPGGLHPVLLQELPTIKGLSCTASPNNRDLACIADADWSSISLNGGRREIYDTPDPFGSAIELQTLDIAVGSTVTTTTVPPFQLEVTEIIDKQVGMKITTPDDLLRGVPKSTVYIPSGDTDYESVASDSPDEITPTIYGFTAAIKHDGSGQSDSESKPAQGTHQGSGNSSKESEHNKVPIVTVRVLKSVTGPYSLKEGDLVWSPNSHRIAAVETNDLGQHWLVLLNRQAASASSESEDSARFGDPYQARNAEQNQNYQNYLNGIIDAREPLPIAGPISRIEFTSDTHIRVEGATQVFDQDIPAHGKVRDTTNYTITNANAMPKQMAVQGGMPNLYGWVCQ